MTRATIKLPLETITQQQRLTTVKLGPPPQPQLRRVDPLFQKCPGNKKTRVFLRQLVHVLLSDPASPPLPLVVVACGSSSNIERPSAAGATEIALHCLGRNSKTFLHISQTSSGVLGLQGEKFVTNAQLYFQTQLPGLLCLSFNSPPACCLSLFLLFSRFPSVPGLPCDYHITCPPSPINWHFSVFHIIAPGGDSALPTTRSSMLQRWNNDNLMTRADEEKKIQLSLPGHGGLGDRERRGCHRRTCNFPGKKSLRPLMHCGNNNNSAPVKPWSNCWDDYFLRERGGGRKASF